MAKRSWKKEALEKAVASSTSIRQILSKLELREAGGNYEQIKKYIEEFQLDTSHFKGRAWNKGMRFAFKPRVPLDKILVRNSNYQSYKLKKRLFRANLKNEKCEECGWARQAEDKRIPLELDHINGNSKDNRIENLRVLCPNCHSLKSTHRGKNRKRGRVAESADALGLSPSEDKTS